MNVFQFTFPLLVAKEFDVDERSTFIWKAEEGSILDNFFTQCCKVDYSKSLVEENTRYKNKKH